MSDAAKFNIATQRNEDFGPFEGVFTDADNAPTDLTGWGFELHISRALGQPIPDLAIRNAPTASGSYIRAIEDDGRIELFIAKADVATLPGEPDVDASFFFNLLSIEPDGTRRDFARGRFIAEQAVGMFDAGGGIFVTDDGFVLVTEDGTILRF